MIALSHNFLFWLPGAVVVVGCLVAKLRHYGPNVVGFDCPGCGYGHAVSIAAPAERIWDWNKSLDNPTLHPSLLVNQALAGGVPRCHSIVVEGKITFCADSTHALAGQTVPLPEVEE